MMCQKMMMTMLIFGIALTNGVRAMEDDEEEEEAEVKAVGVSIKTIFPAHPENVHLTAGQPTQALVNFENGADSTYQIEYIGAHLAYAHQADHIMQNLTGLLVNRTVNQGESVGVVYKFTPWKDIDPRDYNLVLQVYFMSEDDNERISLAAFNQTVPVHDGSSTFDVQGLFLVIIVVAGMAFAYNNVRGKKTTTARRTATTTTTTTASTSAEVGTTVGNVDFSYVSTQHRQATRNRSQEGRSTSPKSKK